MPACPRAAEDGRADFQFENRPAEDTSCHYCGSMQGDDFMARLEAGDVELGPSDKSYKVYVHNKGGLPFYQAYRVDEDRSGNQANWRWITRTTSQCKFYFQHLSVEQCQRFVELLNEKKLHIGYPGYFYALPFFITREKRPEST